MTKTHIALLSILVSLAGESLLAEDLSAIANYFHLTSPSEEAGSLGSEGVFIGVGTSSARPPNRFGEVYTRQSTSLHLITPPAEDSSLNSQQLFLSHGTRWPVNFGASLSHSEDSLWTAYGAYLSATVFEGFRLPSFSLRILHEKGEAPWLGQSSSTQVSVASSVGLWSYLGFFYALGYSRGQLTLFEDNEERETYFQGRSIDCGFSLNILPGILKVSVQTELLRGASSNVSARLSARI